MKISIFILIIIYWQCALSQSKPIEISGKIKDAISKKPIANVNVKIKNYGTTTDHIGFFKLKYLPSINDSIFFTCMGYKTLSSSTRSFNPNNLFLYPDTLKINEICVSGKKSNPTSILKHAKKNIQKNYNHNPFNYDVYYRTFVKFDDINIKFKEISLQYNLDGYDKIKNVKHIFTQSFTNEKLNILYSSEGNNFFDVANSYYLKLKNKIKLGTFSNYTYTIDSIYYLNNELIYVIKQEMNHKLYNDTLTSGNIHIDEYGNTFESYNEKDTLARLQSNEKSYIKLHILFPDYAIIKVESYYHHILTNHEYEEFAKKSNDHILTYRYEKIEYKKIKEFWYLSHHSVDDNYLMSDFSSNKPFVKKNLSEYFINNVLEYDNSSKYMNINEWLNFYFKKVTDGSDKGLEIESIKNYPYFRNDGLKEDFILQLKD